MGHQGDSLISLTHKILRWNSRQNDTCSSNNKAGLWEYFHGWVLKAWYGNEGMTVKYKIEGKTMNAAYPSLSRRPVGLATESIAIG